MKRLIFFVVCFLSISYLVNSQTWSGSTTSTGNAYRTGNVGIGVTNPLVMLHLGGDIRGNVNGALRVNSGTGTIDIGSQNADWAHIYTDRPRFIFNKSITAHTGEFASYNTTNLSLKTGATASTNGTARLTILNSNGYVGIGTTSPSELLHIQGGNLKVTVNDQSFLINPNYVYNGSQTGITTLISAQAPNGVLFYDPKEWANADHFLMLTAGQLDCKSTGVLYNSSLGACGLSCWDNSDNLSIDIDGRNGTAKFNGKLTAKEIEVKLNVWADYVFDEEYKLPTLFEVEQYVKENKHLPEVPSATEVQESGVNLGEMDALLLKKIEELTLYVIEQQKEIENLKIQVNSATQTTNR